MEATAPAPAAPAPAAEAPATPTTETPTQSPNGSETTQIPQDATSPEQGQSVDGAPTNESAETPKSPFQEFKTDKSASQPKPEETEGATEAPVPQEPSDWKEAFPEKVRQNTFLNRFDSMEKFMEGVEHLQKLAGKKGLERPDENAPPEHWNEYWDTIGRPTSPDAYEIEDIKDSLGETTFEFNRDQLKEILPEIHKKGFTNDQAQFMMNLYAESQMASEKVAEEEYHRQATETLTNLQRDYKESTDSTIRRALLALENLGIYDVLEKSKLDTNEAIIRAGIKLSQEFSEAVVGQGASVKSHMQRLVEIEESPAFKNARDPNHKKAVAQRLQIIKEMN